MLHFQDAVTASFSLRLLLPANGAMFPGLTDLKQLEEEYNID
jgi:hypothetical protein